MLSLYKKISLTNKLVVGSQQEKEATWTETNPSNTYINSKRSHVSKQSITVASLMASDNSFFVGSPSLLIKSRNSYLLSCQAI